MCVCGQDNCREVPGPMGSKNRAIAEATGRVGAEIVGTTRSVMLKHEAADTVKHARTASGAI